MTDRPLARGRSLADVAAAAVRGGVTMVQLREKTASTRAFVEEAQALMALLQPLGVPLIVNDRVDVALAIEADGVHVGQDDMPVETVRRLIGPERILGLSITSMGDLRAADLAHVDYLGVGPVFSQNTKSDAAPPLDTNGLAVIRRATRLPIVAIGGISSANAADLMAHGIQGVAVVSAIMAADDPEAAAAAFQK